MFNLGKKGSKITNNGLFFISILLKEKITLKI